jgi:hypothetical protein
MPIEIEDLRKEDLTADSSGVVGWVAVVSLTPHDGAHLYQAVRAKDGATAGLALSRISRRITVSSWVGGRYQGSLVLAPPGR